MSIVMYDEIISPWEERDATPRLTCPPPPEEQLDFDNYDGYIPADRYYDDREDRSLPAFSAPVAARETAPEDAFTEDAANRFDGGEEAFAEEEVFAEEETFAEDEADAFVADAPASEAQQSLYEDVVAPPKHPLKVISSTELADRCFPRKAALVEGFLYAGLTVLAGAPKVGKSWLVLHLCMQIAKGKPFFDMPTKQSGVLYIALEDDEQRLQRRVLTITDDLSPSFYMTTRCSELSEEFEKELCLFLVGHRDVKLIVIDTFQKIRPGGREMSYANDYSEVSLLKNIADTLNISILLVHHTRKMGDKDYMNEISGTNGIAGSADTLMVLKKEKRTAREATLSCTGRDIEDREFTLKLDRESCIWQKLSDTGCADRTKLPPELERLTDMMRTVICYDGTNAGFAELFRQKTGCQTSPNRLKRLMNLHRYELEDRGVSFESGRKQNRRTLSVSFRERTPLKQPLSQIQPEPQQ